MARHASGPSVSRNARPPRPLAVAALVLCLASLAASLCDSTGDSGPLVLSADVVLPEYLCGSCEGRCQGRSCTQLLQVVEGQLWRRGCVCMDAD